MERCMNPLLHDRLEHDRLHRQHTLQEARKLDRRNAMMEIHDLEQRAVREACDAVLRGQRPVLVVEGRRFPVNF